MVALNSTLARRRASRLACAVSLSCLAATGLARGQQAAVDSLPGSPRPAALGMSPEAPPTPPAAGGRAPSFAAPVDPDAWVLRIGGRFSAWAQVGLGRTPADRPGEGTAFHTPPRTVGKNPMYGGTAATLSFQYGNQKLMAYASYEAALTSPEWEGYHRAESGPRVRTAYVTASPAPIGRARLRFQVGAFPANYGAPGPWGWGLFGPVLAVRGYGGLGALDYELSPDKLLTFEYGISAVDEVSEAFVRGTYTQWPENGLSSIVNHAHVGLTLQNRYIAKLHAAYADGRNMRQYLDDDPETVSVVERGTDGSMQMAALELRAVADPYGQLGVTPVFWNFDNARSVHDGIWWGLDWTAGGREMTGKFLGPRSEGTGKIAAVSAEYDFSVARIFAHPRPFDGNAPDVRVALAFVPFWTLKSDDPNYDGADGYLIGADVEYVMLSWLSSTYRVFGESRDATMVNIRGITEHGRWTAFNASLGLSLHSDWQSRDRMELLYSRYFYSDFTDNNSAQPLDRNVFTLGASMVF